MVAYVILSLKYCHMSFMLLGIVFKEVKLYYIIILY